jgi:hypothetical protein
MRKSWILSVLWCLIWPGLAAAALDIPLSVKENAGVGALSYPVSAVVPLARGLIHDPGTLGIAGTPSQVEVMERWPGDGSLRHVLVHFPATVPAHGNAAYHLTDSGPMAPAVRVRVEETPAAITVTTGPLRFTVSKTAFNLFDQVWYDGNHDGVYQPAELIVPSEAHNGGVLTPRPGAGPVQYAADRGDVAVTIEERGPLRAVIRAEAPARFTSTTDHLHGFAVRIYAYAGLPMVKIDYQLQNSDRTVVRSWPLYFEAFDVHVRLALASPIARFGLGDGTVYQGSPGLFLAQEMHDRFGIYAFPGNNLLSDGTAPDGFIDVSDGERGVTAVMRNLWQMWPGGLSIDGDNRLSFQLFPHWSAQWMQGGFTSSGLYWLEDMQHVYKELLLSFHGATPGDAALRALAATFQVPPLAVVPTDWHRTAQATLDLDGVIPPAQAIPPVPDRRLPEYRGEGFDPADWYNIASPFYGAGWVNFGDPEPGYRSYACMHGGWPYTGAHTIATGNPADYFEGEAHAMGEMNLRPQWMTGYEHDRDWPALRLTENPYCGGRWRIFEGHGVSKLAAPPLPGTGAEEPVYFSRDDQHGWFYHVADTYLLTGNPWIGDWYRFIAQFRRVHLQRLDPFPDTSSRAMGHAIHNAVAAARITGDEALLNTLADFVRLFLRPEQDPVFGDQLPSVEAEGGGFQTGYLMRAIIAYLTEMRSRGDWQAYAEGFSYLSGLMEWNYHYGNFPYYFNARDGGSGVSSGTGLTLVDPVAWYYRHTGKQRYLDHLNQYVTEGINGGETPYGRFDSWGGQFEGRYYLFVQQTERTQVPPPPPIGDLRATALSGSSVRLQWTVPAGAVRFHILWSSKPIAGEQTEDSSRINWWAAATTALPAAPGPGGRQSLDVEGVTDRPLYAAVISFDENDTMSAISNVASTDGGAGLRSLTVTKTGTGRGTVSSAPGGIACGQACSAGFLLGAGVTLTAAPDPGSTFTGWSGCDSTPAQDQCIVTMNEDRSASAAFAINRYSLTATTSGTGTGAITASGLTCSGTSCTGTYDHGTSVTLTATPGASSIFSGWSGCDSASGKACTVVMTAGKSVTAAFTLLRTLTVAKSGSGTVSSSPAGIGCPGDCSEAYPLGTVVTLTPIPQTASIFAYWTGACTGGAPTCTVTMNADTAVTAVFVPAKIKQFRLAVSKMKTNLGEGTVLSSDGAINCGNDCVEIYYSNTPVVLTATPNPGSVFVGWTNCPSPSGAKCSVTMDKAYTIRVAFIGPSVLTVTKTLQKKGAGVITSSPAGIDCGSTCKKAFVKDTIVTLTATPNQGSAFTGWLGPCSGTGLCTVKLDRNTAVRAAFTGVGTMSTGEEGQLLDDFSHDGSDLAAEPDMTDPRQE